MTYRTTDENPPQLDRPSRAYTSPRFYDPDLLARATSQTRTYISFGPVNTPRKETLCKPGDLESSGEKLDWWTSFHDVRPPHIRTTTQKGRGWRIQKGQNEAESRDETIGALQSAPLRRKDCKTSNALSPSNEPPNLPTIDPTILLLHQLKPLPY